MFESNFATVREDSSSPCDFMHLLTQRLTFCTALMSEKRKDYTIAMEGYVTCLNQCAAAQTQTSDEVTTSSANEPNPPTTTNNSNTWTAEGAASNAPTETAAAETPAQSKLVFMKELRGEVMLRIAVLKKEMGAIDQAMQMCNTISGEPFGDSIRANALCLKVRTFFFF